LVRRGYNFFPTEGSKLTNSSNIVTASAAPRLSGGVYRQHFWTEIWPLFPVFLFLGLLFIYPVSQLFILSLKDTTGDLTISNYQRLFGSTTYIHVLGITFWFTLWTMILCVGIGYLAAYVLSTTKSHSKNWLILFVVLPFWTSFLVRTFAWIVLLGRHGPINEWLKTIGLIDAPMSLIYNQLGVMVGLVHSMMPLAILTMLSVMETIDERYVDAARTLGARRGQAFWRVYFPLSIPGAASAGLLVFVSTIGFFITPALLGSGKEITISQVIIDLIMELNWGFGSTLGIFLLIMVLLAFFLYDSVFGLSSISLTSGSDIMNTQSKRSLLRMAFNQIIALLIYSMGWLTDRLSEISERVWARGSKKAARISRRPILFICLIVVISFLMIPTLFIIPISFTEGNFLSWPPVGFSLKWYYKFFSSSLWIFSVVRSFGIALGTSVLAMLIGVPAAFAIARGQFRSKSLVLAFVLSPLMVPRIIIAIALFYFYARIHLVGSSLGLLLGHTVLAIPFVTITMLAVLKTYNADFDQAARSLGASKTQVMRHVTLPILMPGMIAAFLFAFVTSFDELTIALFVTGGLISTLPKQMWDFAILNVGPIVAAASTITLILVTAIILLASHFQKKLE
jgi:putative spermidine/putrescine transport system permease protein